MNLLPVPIANGNPVESPVESEPPPVMLNVHDTTLPTLVYVPSAEAYPVPVVPGVQSPSS